MAQHSDRFGRCRIDGALRWLFLAACKDGARAARCLRRHPRHGRWPSLAAAPEQAPGRCALPARLRWHELPAVEQSIAFNDPSLIDQGDLTAVNSPDLQPFDPFTQNPAKGINYALRPTFGHALSAAAYQQPRTFRISMGVRF